MWDGINCRKFPRMTTKVEANICFDDAVNYVSAFSDDIGPGGLCVTLDKKIDKFSKVSLKLELDDERPPIECDGRVVWLVEKRFFGQHKSNYDIGIEFININLLDCERIKTYIAKHLDKSKEE